MCNKCNQTTNNCGCTETITQTNICNSCEQTTCDCPVMLDTDCSTYTGDDITCQDTVVVPKNTILSDALSMIVSYFCGAIEEVKKYLRLINVGTGAEIYAGDNLLGEKKLRKINSSSPIITVIENTDDISVGIDEDELDIFIETNQKTYSVENVGDGIGIYTVPDDVVGNNTEFNLKSFVSDTLTISDEGDEIHINIAETAQIPALYVNNLYVPTYNDWVKAGGNLVTNPSFEYKGEGTLAKPFTDSIRYTSTTTSVITANTSIQNALDSYVGSGTTLIPEKLGQKIIIQDNNSSYTFNGNFEYAGLNVEVQSNINSTTTGYLIDMDNALTLPNINVINIVINQNKTLSINGEGFKNDGTTEVTNNNLIYKQIRLLGEGTISFLGSDINKYLLTSDKDSNGNGTVGFNNDGAWHFEIRCYLASEFQGLVALGGKGFILSLGGTFQTGTVFSDVDVNLKAFNLKGGQLRLRRNSTVVYYGSNSTTRLKLFTLEPTNTFTPSLEQSNTILAGNVVTLYSKENNSNVDLIISESGGFEANSTNIFDSTNLWNVSFKNNFLNTGSIDFTKVDLTQGNSVSSTNTIGNNIVESLVRFNSKQSAQNAGLTTNSKFLKFTSVNTGSFIIGEEYKISNVGDTDFTLIGADSNTVGEWFVATGVGGGTTGVAVKESTEVL